MVGAVKRTTGCDGRKSRALSRRQGRALVAGQGGGPRGGHQRIAAGTGWVVGAAHHGLVVVGQVPSAAIRTAHPNPLWGS